ncbi:hypothetical protein FSP39_008405 [Pinctada imbricata]|uniref:Integrase catalytic domain-containing protein n=1 Tax=Pinctada imbricata TaxID=66713 RepID=A0AA88YVQ1_PINIB|nr:hypothetical protein FSP39_008405 [Pinctada imbricata]
MTFSKRSIGDKEHQIQHRNTKHNRLHINQRDQWTTGVDLGRPSAKLVTNGIWSLSIFVIDIFSRFLWVETLQDKRGTSVVAALKKVFAYGRKPFKIRHDGGSEFTNKTLDNFLKRNDVEHFQTYNTETKANYTERVIGTLKRILYRYFTHNKTYKFQNVLQDLVSSYNKRPHRGIFNLAPTDVNSKNEREIWRKTYLPKDQQDTDEKVKQDKTKVEKNKKRKHKSKTRFKFKIDDFVRVSFVRYVSQRAYHQSWSEELFKVKSRVLRENLPVYTLQDMAGDDIKWSYYQPELQKVTVKNDKLWSIEQILRKRKRKGQTECLIRWRGYPSKFDSWVQESKIKA